MRAPATASIKDAKWRSRIQVAGRIRSLRVQAAEGFVNLDCEISDETGDLLVIFQGRPRIPGLEVGARLIVEGMVGLWKRRLAIVNPSYQLVSE
jgi:RecG-like helicase